MERDSMGLEITDTLTSVFLARYKNMELTKNILKKPKNRNGKWKQSKKKKEKENKNTESKRKENRQSNLCFVNVQHL